jgi:hypothetical protein
MDPSVVWRAPSLLALLGARRTLPAPTDPTLTLAVVGGAALLAATSALAGAARLPAPAATKPFATFSAFYPFYLTQHSRRGTRLAHCAGTLWLLAAAAADARIGVAVGAAAGLGCAVFPLLRGLSTGLLEFALVGAAYAGCALTLGVAPRLVAAAPLGAYFFAWLSHAAIERNRPATFIYPTFSLLGDFVMCFEFITGTGGGGARSA